MNTRCHAPLRPFNAGELGELPEELRLFFARYSNASDNYQPTPASSLHPSDTTEFPDVKLERFTG